MNAPLKAVGGTENLDAVMREIGRDARRAARALALAPASQKNKALTAMAEAIRGSKADILAANAEDLADVSASTATPAFLDRLTLDADRIEAMAEGLDVIRKLNAALVDALADATVRQRLTDLGQELPARERLTPEALGAYQKAEIEKWWPIIKAAGIKVQ